MQARPIRSSTLCWILVIGFGVLNGAPTYAQSDAEATPAPTGVEFGAVLGKRPATQTSDCSPDNECDAITDVILLMDQTQSMASFSRNQIAQWAAFDVLDAVPLGIPTAIFSLHDDAAEVRPLEPLDGEGRSLLRRTIIKFEPSGRGKLTRLVALARQQLAKKSDCARPLIVIITDGEDCDAYGAFGDVGDLFDSFGDRLRVSIIGVNARASAQTELRELAATARTRGHFFAVKSSTELSTALVSIRKHLATIDCSRRAEIAAIQQSLTVTQNQWITLTQKWVTLNQKSEHDKQTITVHLQTIQKLRQSIEELKLQIGKLEVQSTRLQGSLRIRETTIERLTRRIDELEQEIISKQTLLVRRNVTLSQLKRDVVRISAEDTVLKESITTLKRDLANAGHDKFIYQIGMWILGSTVIALLTSIGFMIYRLARTANLERNALQLATWNQRSAATLTGMQGCPNAMTGEGRPDRPDDQAKPQLTTQESDAASRPQDESQRPETKGPTGSEIGDKAAGHTTRHYPKEPADRQAAVATVATVAPEKDYQVGLRIVANYHNQAAKTGDVNYFAAAHRRVAEAYRQVCNFELPAFGDRSTFDRLWAIRIDPQETWIQLDPRYRGKGAVGAMASIGKATLVEEADIWTGQLLPGAVLQTWKKQHDFELARDGIRAKDSGYCFLFLKYVKRGDQIVGLQIADELSRQNRVLDRNEFEYWVAGNLHS